MAISDDWDVDFVNKLISHIDGRLNYNSNTGTAPSAGDYIQGGTTNTIGKIVTGSDLGGTGGTGSLDLTSVDGRFQDAETLSVLDRLPFKNITNNGFQVGDTITANGKDANITVVALEYNYQNSDTAGTGRIYGVYSGSVSFADNDQLDISGGQTDVADAAGAEVLGANFTGAAVNEASTGTISPVAGQSGIINFDNPSGTPKAVPRFAKIQGGTSGASATVQQVYGTAATGSFKLVDVSGTFQDNENIIVADKLNYNNLQSGQKFKVGDKIVGNSSSATGKIIAIEIATSTTGTLTLQNQSGTFSNAEQINVRTTTDTYVADVANTTFTEDHNTDVNGTLITEQLDSQGGVYNGDSLNIVRDSNELYTFLQDTFDELGALDDDVPMTAQVSLQQYTLVNGWKIPDPSFRFLESGSIQDETLDNIWTNYQTLGTVEGIGESVYAATTPLPQFYIEQDGSVLDAWWYYGHIDVLVKVRTNTDPTLTDTDEGVLIDSGTVTIFNRNYTHTYDHFETTTVAGVAPIPLATSNDLDNQTGTHSLDYQNEASGPFTTGEEIVDNTDATKRGVITSLDDQGTTGTIEYILTGTTNFANTDSFTGQTSGATADVNGAPTQLVSGYGSRIVVATVQRDVTYVSGTGAAFTPGEQVTWDSGVNSAILMADSNPGGATGTITLGNISDPSTLNDADVITDGTRSVTIDTGGVSTVSQIQRDIGDGNGNQPYNAVIYLNRDDQADGDTLARMYEWIKFRTRSLETGGEPEYSLLGGKGSETGVQGRLYISLDSSYALVKASPLGTFAGGQYFGARGIFIQDMANDDIRNYQLIDANGTVRNPPNLQTLTVSGVVSGDRVAVFRTDPAIGSTAIMTDEFAVDTVGGGFNQAADSIIKVKTNNRAVPMPSNIPDTGVIRVLDPTDTGLFLSFRYDSVSRSNGEFTLATNSEQPSGQIGDVTSSNDLVQDDDAFVVFIEEEATSTSVSNNIIYDETDTVDGGPSFPILTRVRRKGILPFEVTGNFSSTGASVAAIRSFDSIVD